MAALSKDKRNQMILVIIASIALIWGVWYGVIGTRKSQLSQNRSKRDKAKDRVEQAERRLKEADKIEAEMHDAVRRLKAMEEGMAPASDPYSWSYIFLDKAKAGHKVEVTLVTRPQTNEVGVLPAFPYPAATFSVSGFADYPAFGKFLADFENNFPYFRAQNLTLQLGSEAGPDMSGRRAGTDTLAFKIDVVALIRPNQ